MRACWAAGIAVLAMSLGACAPGPAGWELGPLLDRYPEVDRVEDHRLEQALPYFAQSGEGLVLFLCRWEAGAPIPVWLPPQASAEQSALLERAVAAWEGAGLGIRFETDTWQGEPPASGIVFELVEPVLRASSNAASTIVDCAVPREVSRDGEPEPDVPVDAVLRYASIHLTATRSDLLGRLAPLAPFELVGAAVHEMGHALGFAGHVAQGGSVMSAHAQMDATRRWGKRILRGETLEAPTLAALYAAPSGARVGWLPLVRGQLDPLRTLSEAASQAAVDGPYVRVGAESARILWRDPPRSSVALIVVDWPSVLQGVARFEPRLNRRARLLIEARTVR